MTPLLLGEDGCLGAARDVHTHTMEGEGALPREQREAIYALRDRYPEPDEGGGS